MPDHLPIMNVPLPFNKNTPFIPFIPQLVSQDPIFRAIQDAMESCYGRAILSSVVGFSIGGLFGLLVASISYNTPFGSRFQGANSMGARSRSMAKNFGKFGGLRSGIECGIEGLRAKNDLVNSMTAGCLTGAILAKNAGPQAVAEGCVLFAVFGTAVDVYMRQPSDE